MYGPYGDLCVGRNEERGDWTSMASDLIDLAYRPEAFVVRRQCEAEAGLYGWFAGCFDGPDNTIRLRSYLFARHLYVDHRTYPVPAPQ